MKVNRTALNSFSVTCFLHPFSFRLKVPAVSLPSFQRMTPSPTTQVTQTAAAVRVMMLTKRHSF